MTPEETATDRTLDVANLIPRSLIISPNLDALVEHDERTRCQTAGHSHTPPSGLPPPPRRSRGPKPLRTSTEEEILAAIPSSPITTSNPYINPAPTLDETLHVGMLSTLASSPARDHDGSVECAMPWSPNDAQKSTPAQRSHHAAATQNSDDVGLEPLTKQPVSTLSRTRSGGELVEHISDTKKSINNRPALNMPQTDRGQNAGGVPWRRPLISHGRPSSMSSFDSVSSSTTNRPTSTAENEPRISISSTIYPASSTQSHSHSLYNEPIPTNYRNSFIDLYSPEMPELNLELISPVTDGGHEPVSPIRFSEFPISEIIPSAFEGQQRPSKPPIPTTPKPKFSRATTRPRQPFPMPTPPSMQSDLPPTTNLLDMDERAGLVKKSRKLARVFGQTPGADAMAQQDSGRSTNNNTPLQTRSRGVVPNPTGGQRPWRSVQEPFGVAGPRRHSMPLSPDDVSFIRIKGPIFDSYPSPSNSKFQDDIYSQGRTSSSDAGPRDAPNQIRSSSPTSFIDLSDDGARAVKASSSPTIPNSLSLDAMSLEESADNERRRKRERLAKLHRFLGSRVPANLVLGIDDVEASLPPPSPIGSLSESDDANIRKAWLKRRRCSSVALATPAWDDGIERAKSELDDREKAINVRRAQKMEKVFGVAPPQTLYHTRQCPAPLLPSVKVVAHGNGVDDAPQAAQRSLNINKPAYVKPKKHTRPGTAESSKRLLPKGPGSSGFDEPAASLDTRHSPIYNHYQHSLNSLNVMLDRDDRESLAELHQYLNNTDVPTPQLEDEPRNSADRRMSVSSSIKSERRRSLPANTSILSLASEYTISTPKAEITAFQLRRRRAAKLTHFFGVNYRELINDVLDSIENGVQHEQQRGTLRAEEAEDLLSKLRSLKTKRQGLF